MQIHLKVNFPSLKLGSFEFFFTGESTERGALQCLDWMIILFASRMLLVINGCGNDGLSSHA